MTEGIADFLLRKAQEGQNNTLGAAQLVLGTVEDKPDDLAGDLNLAKEFAKTTGNPTPPTPLVKEYRNVFQQKIEEAKNKTILSSSPRLTQWLVDPENAALSKDDLPGLSYWEGLGNALNRGVMRVPQAFEQSMASGAAERSQDQARGFGEILSDQRAIRDSQGNILGARPIVGADDLFMAGSRWLTSRLADAFSGDQKAAAAYYQQQAGEFAKRIAATPMDETGERYKKAYGALKPTGDIREDFKNFVGTVAADPAGFTSFLSQVATESVPLMAVATAATAATRNPATGATIMGASSYAQEAGTSPVDFFQERGIDVSTPEGATKVISDPELMREAIKRGQTRGLIVGIMDAFSGGVAGKELAKNPIADMVLQSITQAAFGAGGEAGAQVASGQQFNINEVLMEGLAEFVTAPVEAAGVGGRSFLDGRRKARNAEARQALFQELSGQAVNSKLRARMPDKFRDFVARATENGPVENVYVPAEQFVQYFQSVGVDPHAVIDDLEGVTRDDLDAALAGGGDLQIPTATYAAKIAGSDHDAFLMENMRFDPNEMTAAEAREFNEKAQDALQEAWEVAEQIRLEEDSLRSFEQEIYDTMVSRLRVAGRSTDVATTEAMLYPAFYRVMAQRSGMTTEEFMQRYPLPEVRGDLPQGLQLKDVSELNRTLAQARSRKATGQTRRGPSLLEFISDYGGINDPGGELRARNAAVINRGKGKKTLKLERSGVMAGAADLLGAATGSGKKHGVDDVALAAVEAGYLADHPDVQAWRYAMESGAETPDITRALWEAIDQELRGEAQYAGQGDPDAEARERDLDEIEAYLSSLGVSLDDDDAAIRQAIEGARQYGQFAGVKAKTLGRNAPNLGRAMQMEREGVYSDEIFETTGFFRGVDGKWRFEISDQDAKIKPGSLRGSLRFKDGKAINGQSFGGQLSDLLDHVLLFEAYPQLADVRVEAIIGPDEGGGSADFENRKIVAKGKTVEGMRSVLLHEIAHFIQGIEGFANGGNLSLGEVYEGEKVSAAQTTIKFLEDNLKGAYEAGDLNKVEAVQDRLEKAKKSLVRAAQFEYYRRIAGEVEARNVQERDRLRQAGSDVDTPEWTQDVPNDQQIIIAVTDRKGEAYAAHDRPSAAVIRAASGGQNLLFQGATGTEALEVVAARQRVSDLEARVRAAEEAAEQGRDPADDVFDLYGELSDALDEHARVLGEQPGGLVLADSRYGLGAMISRNPDAEGDWRFTRFNKDGFIGHIAFDTKEQAIREAFREGYRDENRNLLKELSPRFRDELFQDMGGPRGSIQFPSAGVGNGDTVIRLFQTADLSTMVHESGHYFLAVMRDMAAGGGDIAQDFEAVKAWWRSNAQAVAKDAMRVIPDVQITADDVIAALDNGTTGDVMKDAAVDVGMQEQWARAVEAYLMEGKAPSVELRSAFEKFRAWLISVYKRLTGLNVPVSDDIRRVFDRMLATDEEIEKAQQQTGGDAPIFTSAEAMGLTPDEYANFLKLRSQAEDEAKARLLRETMEPIKREQEKWYKDERAKVHEEVEREVNAYPYFRAIEWMGNRRWLGEGQPDSLPDIRLSKDILVERYGEGVLKTLPRGKQTVYTVEGGVDPDDVAGWFGFDSGDAMIRAMERAPKRRDAIEAEVERIMFERHGDPLKDGSAEAQAMEAVHNDKRGQWIAAELKAVIETAGTGTGMTAKEARATARATLARMRVRDAMNAGRFLAAERKAADEAARLGAMLAREGIWMNNARRRIATKARAALRGEGSVDAVAPQIEQANRSTGNYNETVTRLIDAKRRQLLNHSLYMEARKVADEIEAAERFVAKLGKKSTRERIAGAGRRENAQVDYLGAIDEILERYDFRRLSGAAEARRGKLAAFIAAMTAAGRENELAIPDAVLSDAARKPYKTIPVEELRGVIDSLKNLEHIATRWDKLIDAQKERDLNQAVDEIAAAFDANLPKRPPGRLNTTAEALRNTGRQFLDLVLNAGTILREIDGFADMGAAYRNIKAPIDEAMNRLIGRKEKAANDLEALYSVYSKEDRRRMAVREHMPALGFSLSKWERIAVALNTGNAGNFQRLTDTRVRGSLTPAQVEAVLASLDERDADFVQSVWDYVASFKDDIAAREKRTTGVEPAWVEAQPVAIAGKTLKGGYYPLKYDPRLSALSRDDAAADLAGTLQAGRFGKAQTKNGHIQARAQSSGRAVDLDMSVLHRHINQVIYDLELSEAVANSWRILQNGRVRSAFIDAGKQADFDALEIWLQDVGTGEIKSADIVGRGARMLKSNFTAAKLAFNLSTVLMQITGLSQSMVVAGKRNMAVGIMQAAKNPIAMANEVAAKSPFMATRQTTFNKDIYDFYSDPKTGPVASRWGDIKSEVVGPLAFWLMTKVQWYLADVPTWLAGYHQGLQKYGNDEAKAIAHADDILKRSQASGLFSDRSAIERGSLNRTARQNDVVRLFTALGSYMFAKFNVAYERSATASRTIRSEGLSLRSAQEALSWTLDMAFLFTLEAVITAAIKGQLPGDDGDDEDKDGWLAFLSKQTAFSVMATVPFVRDVASPLQGFDGGGAYGAITKEVATPLIQIGQGEVDRALVKSIINTTGLATGVPSTQINRAVDAAWRQAEGKDVSPLEYIMGRSGK